MPSLAEELAALPPDARAAVLAGMSDKDAAILEYDWSFWGRPEQIAPVGEWSTWLALCGRGWGKTEAGAQWIRQRVANGARHIALIAETQKDLEEVMVPRIISVHPPAEAPSARFKPVRLTWPNGAVALGYNGTEPNQLRGPEFDTCWCFCAGTMIATPDGERDIKDIRAGDYVLTRNGPRRVAFNSAREAQVGGVKFSNGKELTGTAEHPVLKSHGWTRLSDLRIGDDVCAINVSNGAASAGIATAADITNIAGPRALAVRTATLCTAPSTGQRTEKSRPASTSITRTAIFTIICRATLRLCQKVSIAPCTAPKSLLLAQIGRALNQSFAHAGIAALPSSAKRRQTAASRPSVSVASKEGQTSAGHLLSAPAFNVVQRSPLGAGTIAVSVVSTWEPAGRAIVYNLQVDGTPEYFANGILVHNCDELAKYRYAQELWDMLQFTMRRGDPRVFVTTTPRPLPLIKAILADKRTIGIRRPTSDNAANLPAQFMERMQERYEGTRLGRQELNGEILDDVPGALWTRDMLDDARKSLEKMPDMARVVVAIDPSGAKNIDDDGADDIGIVVAGKGVDGRAYVLADRTCKLSPAGWGRRAVDAYKEFKADRLVAEINFGGALVQHVIRTTDPMVSYREVHASRGKVVRAEPVAALYEQGRVTHIGDLALLEDQMCQMRPDGYVGEGSPDRVDALVWAITDLMLTTAPTHVDPLSF